MSERIYSSCKCILKLEIEVVSLPTSLGLEGRNFSAVFKKIFFFSFKKFSTTGDKQSFGAYSFDQAQAPLC